MHQTTAGIATEMGVEDIMEDKANAKAPQPVRKIQRLCKTIKNLTVVGLLQQNLAFLPGASRDSPPEARLLLAAPSVEGLHLSGLDSP